MTQYVGLDVHSKSSTFVVQDEAGKVVSRGTVPTSPGGLKQLRDQCLLEPGTAVALESGTVAFHAAGLLSDLGLTPQVINASEVRAKASRPLQKSDSRDALELCEGVRRGIYRSIVWVPPSALRELREALSRRRHFVRLKSSQINAVKRMLRGMGHGELSCSLRTALSWDNLLLKLEAELRLQEFIRCHQMVWLRANEQVGLLEETMMELAEPWKEQISRLMTVPGVGIIVACTALAVLFDARRFASAKNVASYIGVVPSTNQSGPRDFHGHITRCGSNELRSMLCEAAHHSQRPQSPFNPYFSQICVRRGYRMAIVAVAHRLSRILYAMLRDGTEFDLAKAGVEEGTFEKVSRRSYRRRSVQAIA